MSRIYFKRFACLGLLLWGTGCSWWENRTPLFQRCHSNNNACGTAIPSYSPPNCGCDTGAQIVSGPILQPNGMIPVQPNGTLQSPTPIPRIEENGKQMPWDGTSRSTTNPGNVRPVTQ